MIPVVEMPVVNFEVAGTAGNGKVNIFLMQTVVVQQSSENNNTGFEYTSIHTPATNLH